MEHQVELMNLFWATAGLFPGTGEISRFDFKDRVEAAAKAGFAGIGIWHTDLEHILLHRTLNEMKLILDDNGMKYLELEFLTDWFLDGARKAESDNRKRRLLEASAALNARHVKVGDFYSSPYSMPRLIESFAALCQEAEDYGATIGFEFMASSMIHTLADSLALVETVGAKNGGLIVDIVHVVTLGIPYEEIRRIPVQYLVSVELNDGLLPRNPMRDPSGARNFCGEGEFDIRGFIESVKQTGYTGPWAVEVFSEEVARLPLDEVNKQAYQTTIAQFEN
jgi:sugar phosphate isomerase/epimerase